MKNEDNISFDNLFGSQWTVRKKDGKKMLNFLIGIVVCDKGYIDSLQLMDVMGTNYVNKNETYIKFYCKEIKKEEMRFIIMMLE